MKIKLSNKYCVYNSMYNDYMDENNNHYILK